MAALLNMLANLYTADRRPDEAAGCWTRALAIFATVKARVPNDQIQTFNSEAAIHIQRGEWRKAEEVRETPHIVPSPHKGIHKSTDRDTARTSSN
jgi:hypothetical protein